MGLTASSQGRIGKGTLWGFSLFKNNFIYIFIGCARSALLHGLSSTCREKGLLSSSRTWASHCGGFSCRGVQALGLVSPTVQAQELWCTVLVAPWHMIFLDRGQTPISFTGGWILDAEPPGKLWGLLEGHESHS